MATTDRGIISSIDIVIGSAPPLVVVSVVSLRPCGTQSIAPGSDDYLRSKDNPFTSEIEGAEDSL